MEAMVINKLAKILSEVIYFFVKITPKNNWAIIQTFPIWEENGVVIYKELLKTSIDKIIWLVPEVPSHVPFYTDIERTLFIKRKSIRGVIYYSLAKYVFLTHGLYNRKFPSNQLSINLWHGMPLKRIGLENDGEGLYTDYAVSTSKFFQKTLSKSFGINESSVLNIGLPRNELLIKKDFSVYNKLDISPDQKVLFWLPTYRKSVVGEIRLDGKDFGNPFNIPHFDQTVFDNFLEKLNIICFFKPHPMADIQSYTSSNNFYIIDDNFLYERNLTLYQTLSISDFIISDISSIVVDYLLTMKPIIFSFADKDIYLKSRGLNSFEILENAPGKICINQQDILEEIQNLISGIDNYVDNRSKLKSLYHNDVQVSHCTSNLLKVIGITSNMLFANH
jgi:CDP-glycerol glycerophosphotransferase